MKARRQSHHRKLSDRPLGMEILDHERERGWLEQMDTILIFVRFPHFGVRLD